MQANMLYFSSLQYDCLFLLFSLFAVVLFLFGAFLFLVCFLVSIFISIFVTRNNE